MEFREAVTRFSEWWIANEKDRPRGVRLPLSDKEIESFMRAAEERPFEEAFQSMTSFLDSMTLMYPVRAPRLKRELKWLQKQMKKKGYPTSGRN